MMRTIDKRLTVLWFGLMIATVFSIEFTSAASPRFAQSVVVLIAFIKARYIGLEFMELRHAPILFRMAFETWCALVAGLLIAAPFFLLPLAS